MSEGPGVPPEGPGRGEPQKPPPWDVVASNLPPLAEQPGGAGPWEDPVDPIDPADPRDVVGDALLVIAAAAGIAGCLMWDIGPVFFFAPLGLAGFALACMVGATAIGNRARAGFMLVAIVATLGAGLIGIDKKSELDQLSEEVRKTFDGLGDYP